MFFFLLLGGFFQDETLFLKSDLKELNALETHLTKQRNELHKAQNDLNVYPIKLEALNINIARVASNVKQRETEFNQKKATIEIKFRELISAAKKELPRKLHEAAQQAREAYLNELDRAQIEAEKEQRNMQSQLQQLKKKLDSASTEKERNIHSQRIAVVVEKLELVLQESFQPKPSDLIQLQSEFEKKARVDQGQQLKTLEGERVGQLEYARKSLLEAKKRHAELKKNLRQAETYHKSLPERIEDLSSSSASLEQTVKRVEKKLQSGTYTEVVKNWVLVMRALCLGALGALAAFIVRPPGKAVAHNILNDSDYWYIVVSQLLVGAITAVAGFALMYTDFLSIFKFDTNGQVETVPDYWKITLLCTVLGAFSHHIYGAVRIRIDRLIRQSHEATDRKEST